MSQGETLREGERRFVTVVFADMSGFTALSERMDPEEMDGVMSKVFSGFEEIIRQYEGTVEKYIGDALVAVFGVPDIHEDDPARAVNAALDFLEHTKRRTISGVDEAVGASEVGFRIGIHTGLITTGKRGRFDVVTGHAMAVASRLQVAAPVNGIYVSEETREKCREEFIFSEPELLQLKGREEDVRAYLVEGKNSQPSPDESFFVDRDREIERLLQGYLRFDPAGGGGFFVTGEAGVGKTRLVSRLIERIRELPEFDTPILRARARQYRRRAFAVVTDVLIHHFDVQSHETRDQLARRMAAVEGVDADTAESFVTLLFDVESMADHARVFLVLYRLVELILTKNETEPYALVIFVDNVRAMDGESRNFFRYLLNDAPRKPFLLFADRRVDDGFREAFRPLDTLELGPLSHTASQELLRKLQPQPTRETDSEEEVLGNAGGNPLFLREYAKLAVERGLDEVSGSAPLPTSIQNMFLSGIQRYPLAYRDLLRKLSVFIHSFTVHDAAYVQTRTEADPEIASAAIEAFERDGILIREAAIYLFKHEVFKQSLYNSILNHNKKILHRVVADRMRAFANPHTGRLLHHLTRAEEWDDVRRLLEAAPDGSFNMEYVSFYDTLLENLGAEDHDARTHALFHKCTILFNNGNSERADSILKQILMLASSYRLPGAAANAYHILTAYNAKSYALEKACFCGRKALYYYEQLADTLRARRNVLKLLSQAELLRNRREASSALVAELDELTEAGDSERISAYAERAVLMSAYGEAMRILEPVLEDDSPELEEYRLGHLYLALMASWFACDFEHVVAVSRLLFRGKHRHYGYRAQAIAQAAGARALMGYTEDVTSRIKQAEFEFYQIRNDFDRVDALRTIAEVCLIVGDPEKAEQLAREGLTIGLRHSAYFPTFTLLMLLVEIRWRREDLTSVRFFLDEASFLVELDPMLRNRDLILYHYFAHRVGFDDAPDAHRTRASEYLDRERRSLGNEARYANFLRLRGFGRVAQDLETLPAQS